MASRFSVEAVFKAVDKVTAPITRMQNKIGKMSRSISRSVRRINKSLAKTAGSFLNFSKVAVASVTAVAAATILSINKVADSADVLAKESRRLQFPIEELQQWRFVAEQSGVSNELLDKSLAAFTKRLGEAKKGVGPLFSSLKKVNPQLLQQLNHTDSVAKAFDIYIKAMRDAQTATQKAALANAGFSRSGLDLVNISNNSADAVEALRKEQIKNGIITQKQAENAEAYNDAVNSLKKTVMGLMQDVIAPMFPMLTKTLRGWRDFILVNKEMIKTRIDKFLKIGLELIEGIGKTLLFISDHATVITVVAASFATLAAVLKIVGLAVSAVNLAMSLNPIGLIIIAIAALIAALVVLIFKWDEIETSILDIVESIVNGVKSMWTGMIDALVGAMKTLANIVVSIWDGIKNAIMGTINKITSSITGFANSALSLVGLGDDESDQNGVPASQVISPQERMSRSIQETNNTTTNKSELTIKDETGRAELNNFGVSNNSLVLMGGGMF
jgi:hypothetical protein